jgi:hypothetical protein
MLNDFALHQRTVSSELRKIADEIIKADTAEKVTDLGFRVANWAEFIGRLAEDMKVSKLEGRKRRWEPD